MVYHRACGVPTVADNARDRRVWAPYHRVLGFWAGPNETSIQQLAFKNNGTELVMTMPSSLTPTFITCLLTTCPFEPLWELVSKIRDSAMAAFVVVCPDIRIVIWFFLALVAVSVLF